MPRSHQQPFVPTQCPEKWTGCSLVHYRPQCPTEKQRVLHQDQSFDWERTSTSYGGLLPRVFHTSLFGVGKIVAEDIKSEKPFPENCANHGARGTVALKAYRRICL